MKKIIYWCAAFLGLTLLFVSCGSQPINEPDIEYRILLSIQDPDGNDLMENVVLGTPTLYSHSLSVRSEYDAISDPIFEVIKTNKIEDRQFVGSPNLIPQKSISQSKTDSVDSKYYRLLYCNFGFSKKLNYVNDTATVQIGLRSKDIFQDTIWHHVQAQYIDDYDNNSDVCTYIDFDGKNDDEINVFPMSYYPYYIITLDVTDEEKE